MGFGSVEWKYCCNEPFGVFDVYNKCFCRWWLIYSNNDLGHCNMLHAFEIHEIHALIGWFKMNPNIVTMSINSCLLIRRNSCLQIFFYIVHCNIFFSFAIKNRILGDILNEPKTRFRLSINMIRKPVKWENKQEKEKIRNYNRCIHIGMNDFLRFVYFDLLNCWQ